MKIKINSIVYIALFYDSVRRERIKLLHFLMPVIQFYNSDVDIRCF